MIHLSAKDIDRFWSKVQRGGPTECWPWVGGAKHRAGYGIFAVATGKSGGKKIVASRVACFLAHGPAPEGKPLSLHHCDNPPCCNGAHVYWGTQKHNVRDAVERKRHSPPPLKQKGSRQPLSNCGEGNVNAKMTDAVVREIWRLHMQGLNCSVIASTVGHTVAIVYDVCRGRSWRHLPDAPAVEVLKTGGVRRGFNQF